MIRFGFCDMKNIGLQDLSENLAKMGLSAFKEGQIGKLRIHKSGRTSLVLGENSLNVIFGTSAGFLQVRERSLESFIFETAVGIASA